jgi:integrase
MKGVSVMYVNTIKNQQSGVINNSKPECKKSTQNKCIKTEWYTKTVKMLQLAGKSDSTQRMYARSVRQLIEFYNKEHTEISERELEDYFLHRRNEDKWTPSTLKISYCGIKFLYQHILKKDWHLLKILKAQPEKRLPCVLSREELFNVLSKVKMERNYTFLFTVYSLGVRLQEGLNIQVSDIDSNRMQVHIHRGKGAKDRLIPLPEDTLYLLREYWKKHRNPNLLFPGYSRGEEGKNTAKASYGCQWCSKSITFGMP